MKAISLWQPWCFAITHLGKDVENRVWQTLHRGPLLLHAAKRRPTRVECVSFCEQVESVIGRDDLIPQLARAVGDNFRGSIYDALRALPRGGIVGRVEIVGCDLASSSPWAFEGQYHWHLARARELPFQAVTGQRGFFEVSL
jgi:hypothetical protein